MQYDLQITDEGLPIARVGIANLSAAPKLTTFYIEATALAHALDLGRKYAGQNNPATAQPTPDANPEA